MLNLTPQQLRRAADIQEQIQALQAELNEVLQSTEPSLRAKPPAATPTKTGRRQLSPQAIANIRAGVRKRMAQRRAAGFSSAEKQPKRKMSAAGKARLSALAKARWRQARAAGKARL